MSPIPYVGFSHDNLDKQPLVHKGDTVTMPCGHDHILQCGFCDGKEDDFLLFYMCEGKPILAAVANHLISYTESDCHGELSDG
jgi:hypothetical protein